MPAAGERTEGVVLVFDGGLWDDPSTIRLAEDELSDWAFVELDQLGGYLPDLQHRRASSALRTLSAGQASYLEDGLPI